MCECKDKVVIRHEGDTGMDKFILQYKKCKDCGKAHEPYIQFFTGVVH